MSDAPPATPASEPATSEADTPGPLRSPNLGQEWIDGHNPDTYWRVDGVGLTSGIVYLRLYIRGRATNCTLEWPANRWRAFVERQLATLRDGD